MGLNWYDMIAKRNGGYKSDAVYTVKGESGETEFERRLKAILPNFNSVLDVGCGHGEFTLKMSKYAKHITGFDNSTPLLEIAKSLLSETDGIDNVEFVYGHTKDDEGLPFEDDQFDLLYCRRGPTSIYKHSRILQSGGKIISIHPGSLEKVKERLIEGGFVDINIETFDNSYLYFPNEIEFCKYISSIPGNPDYSLEENRSELQNKIKEHTIDNQIRVHEWRYIVTATKP